MDHFPPWLPLVQDSWAHDWHWNPQPSTHRCHLPVLSLDVENVVSELTTSSKNRDELLFFFFPWPVSVREVSEVRVTASYYHDKDIPYSLKRCKLLALTHSFSRTHTSVLEKESYSHIDACRCRICIWIQTLVWNTQRSLEIFAHSFQSETGQWEQSHTLANLCQFSLWPMALAGHCHI